MNFDASRLPDILLKQDEMWQDPRSKRELQHPLVTAQVLLENQLVTWTPVMKGRQCIGVSATWLKSCEDNSIDCEATGNSDVDCVIDGRPIQSDSATYKPNICLKDSFAVWDDECADAFSFEEKFAYAMLKAKLNLEKRINTKMIAFLEANTMQNRYTDTYGTIAPTETSFPSALWTADLMAEFDITAEFNEINAPIIISGTNLKNAVYNASFNQLNDDQRDQAAKFGDFDIFFDPRNVNTTTGQRSTFMIDQGSYGFFVKNEFTNEIPVNQGDDKNTMTYMERSMSLNYRDGNATIPLTFDVYVQRKCKIADIGNTKKRRWGTFVEINFNGGIHLAPADCEGGTGMLEFVNV